LGVFISGFRDTTQGAAPIRMCHTVTDRRPEVARFDSRLLSVRSRPAQLLCRSARRRSFVTVTCACVTANACSSRLD